MTKLQRLKKDATASAKFRGHNLKWSGTLGTCKTCDKWVQVMVKPLPNDIEVGGTAVALNCENQYGTRTK